MSNATHVTILSSQSILGRERMGLKQHNYNNQANVSIVYLIKDFFFFLGTIKQAQAQGYRSTLERVSKLDVFFMFAHTSRGQESRPTSHDMQMQLEHLYLFKEPCMIEREEAEGGRREELRVRESEREPDLTCHRFSSPV